MKIFMTGATGFVGTALTKRLISEGHSITLLTRSLKPGNPFGSKADFVEGDPTKKGKWQEELLTHDAVINLAGASIFTRWNDQSKKVIINSRIKTTENIAEAISGGTEGPGIFLSTSAVGYYGFHGDEEVDEEKPHGNDFLASLSRDWESAALKVDTTRTRTCVLRFGIVLGKGGGALKMMLPLFRKYLGSRLGSGRQWFSWIHIEDLVRAHLFVLEQSSISGPVNCTAPNPVTNRELTQTLAKVLGRPSFLPPVPAFALRLVMGEFGSVLLQGQRAVPKRLLDSGFQFTYPFLEKALEEILAKKA